MNKRIAMLSVALLLIISFVSAVQVTDIQQGLETNNAEITSLRAELNSKISQLDQKLDQFATQEDMTSLLTLHLIKVNEILDQFKTMLIVSIIIIMFCVMGMFYGTYFHFKGTGRI